jgi:hypothetical protein
MFPAGTTGAENAFMNTLPSAPAIRSQPPENTAALARLPAKFLSRRTNVMMVCMVLNFPEHDARAQRAAVEKDQWRGLPANGRRSNAHLGTFFLIADATRHHACAALPTPAFIRDQNLIAVTMTCMAV